MADEADEADGSYTKRRKDQMMFKQIQPKEPFTVANQIQRTLLSGWINILLLCCPAGIVLGVVVGPSLPTFFVNYAAVIPLYWLGDFAMTEIGLRTGELGADPTLHLGVALAVFLATTVLLYFCVDYVVNSIDTLTSKSGLSTTFVGVILLPILNCDFTPVISAICDEMNATMDYTVGKSIQTALLVTPLTVLLAWWLGIEGVTLVFDGFEVVSLFATVLLLNLIISEGKSNWAMGVLLLADWALVAIAAFFVV
ncbi:Vacuolar calcium ion transporter [Cytospora mali]|uniref:Vacuolar calcium ion transporter n=1 Tax=Cytospora mali TaxID=578113 RepID=A0A194UWW2_CYTMA|nr:Vacuolar calcium ion transporter [Valsa mali var. pyri (nom. inval.)]